MQDFRRHRAWCPHGRPPGRRRLDLAAWESHYGAFPVWEWMRLPPRPGRPAHDANVSVGPRYLGLSVDLATALRSWADWRSQHQYASGLDEREIPPASDEDWRRWRRIGATLAERLAEETGAEVVYAGVDGPTPVTDCPCEAGPPQPG